MTDTTFTSRVLGEAWPGYFNKPIADDMWTNIKKVGLPEWSAEDQLLAKSLQHELGVKESGMPTEIRQPREKPQEPEDGSAAEPMPMGGGSDDNGDISLNVPTVVLNYPSNIQAGPGHSWANAISMATPIAHKGITVGAKVEALTILDMLTKPELIQSAWTYFKDVETKNVQYKPLIRPQDKPAIWINEKIMAEYRPQMKKLYYDPKKYKTYLEQLGIKYPTVRTPPAAAGKRSEQQQ